MHCHSSYQTSKGTIIYVKMKNREKEIRGGCECESEREKNKKSEGKILFIPRTRVIYFRLYGSGPIGLSRFQKFQPAPD